MNTEENERPPENEKLSDKVLSKATEKLSKSKHAREFRATLDELLPLITYLRADEAKRTEIVENIIGEERRKLKDLMILQESLEKRSEEITKNNQESDPNVTKLFLSLMEPGIHSDNNNIGKAAYQALIENPEKVSFLELDQQNQKFAKTLRSAKKKDGNRARYDKEKMIFHFNDRKSEGQRVAYRIYISPRISESPSVVVSKLRMALKNTGCENVYYKIFEELERRNDQITVYLTEDEIDKFEKVFKEFQKNCPPEYLVTDNLETGIDLAPGISCGANPQKLDNIESDKKTKKFSYNSLIAYSLTVAYAFAHEDHFHGKKNQDYQLQDLEKNAAGYFEQILRIAGINPKTMMDEQTNGGKIPEWMKPYAK